MAILKTTLNGSTIVATANNGANTSITMQCEKIDMAIPQGEYEVLEEVCHNTGVDYVKSQVPKFDTIDMEIWFTGDKTDSERLFWNDAHHNTGDFTQANGDQTLSLAISMNDTNSNVITFNCLVKKTVINMSVLSDNKMTLTLQPTSIPVLT